MLISSSRWISPPWRFVLTVVVGAALCAPSGSAAADLDGTLEIRCATDGATVEIDGQVIGKTPMRPKALPAGRHSLRVSKSGFVDFTDRVSIEAGRQEKLVVNLLAKAGMVRVAADVPGAEVFVDGSRIGTVPLTAEVKVGTHLISVTASGCKAFVQKLVVDPGQSYAFDVKLERIGTAELDLASIPLEPAPPAAKKPSKKGVIGGELALEPLADLPPTKPGSADLELEPLVQPEGGKKVVKKNDAVKLNPAVLRPPSVEEQVRQPRPWYLQWWALSAAGAVIVSTVAVAITVAGSNQPKADVLWTLGKPAVRQTLHFSF